MQKYCVHSANNYFLHVDEIAKNDQRICVIFDLAFKMLLAKCTQKATQNTEKFSHIFHKKGLTFALSCYIIIIGKYGAAGAAPGAVPSAAVALKGTRSAVSSGTPRNRAPAATLVSPVNPRNTLRQQKDGTLLRGCHPTLVRCLCVIRMPVIVIVLLKFRSFPIFFEWIPIFHCLLC